MLNNCDQQTVLALLCFVLVVTFMDNINKMIPQLRNLFNNNINLGLLCIVVLCTILLNTSLGIMLMFVVLYMSMFYRYKVLQDVQESFQNNHLHKQVLQLVADEDTEFNHGLNADSHTTHQENQVQINKAVQELPKEPQNSESTSNSLETAIRTPKNCQAVGGDLLTQTFDNNREGYDVAGCRYDMKASLQNLTMNGPPVAQCGNYQSDKMNMIGAAFYPLNH